MIALALLTCDRHDYTARTLSTFARFNDLRKFILLHGDDASTDPRILPLVHSYGFRSVVKNNDRQGWLWTRTKLLKKAAAKAPWILYLENDIETERPFPWALFRFIEHKHDISCLRLYGAWKDRDRLDRCLTHNKDTGSPAIWKPFRYAPEKSQIGQIHWSAQPSVTRSQYVVDHHVHGNPLGGYTVRVKKNVMFHIGVERTAPMLAPVQEAYAAVPV